MAPNSAIEISAPISEEEDLYYILDKYSDKKLNNEEIVPLNKTYLQLIRTKLNEKYLLDKWKVPWTAVIVSCIQIFVFMLSTDFELVFEFLLFDPDQKIEVWRYLSYILLHADIAQLFLNVVLQLFTSFTLETEQGHWKVFIVCISGGIAGSFGSLIFQPKLLMIGGSACVYSILMSHIPHLIMNFHHIAFKYLRIVSLLILLLSDIGFSVFHYIENNNTEPTISISAHCFGAINGVLIGFIIYSSVDAPSLTQSLLKYGSMIIFICGFCWILSLLIFN